MQSIVTKSSINNLTYKIIGAAIEVHKSLGPGLLESVYHKCLRKEFDLREMRYGEELFISLNYTGIEIDSGLRCDFLIEDLIVVELKAVEEIAPVHQGQLLTYMKLLQKPKGILINFYCDNLFKSGQKTLVNEYFSQLED